MGGLTIRLFNTSNHTQIGDDIIISSVSQGGTGFGYLNLANQTITNSITAAVQIHATSGTASPIVINLNTTNIEIAVTGQNMKVRSGTVVLPPQGITSLDGSDTIDIDPGNGVEIDFIKMKTGSLSYSISEDISLKATLLLTLPSGLRNGDTIKETITVIPGIINNGTIPLDNASLDLGTVAGHPYNMIPVKYTINVSSDNKEVTFDSNDEVSLILELLDPEFDYVKGFFGQETESIDTDSLDLEINEILDNISGEFLISNPSIKINYSNSFAVPIKVDFQATGIRGSKEVALSLPPIDIRYPDAPEEHSKDTIFIIDKNNSKLPELISMPPEKVRFSGSAVMNPDTITGPRDNYLFGDSHFTGSVEVEVPLEFRLNNLQFSDTIDNFLKNDDPDNDNPIKPEDFEYLKIIFSAENGFPIGISLSMSLYDSTSNTIKSSIVANDILKPALIGSNGKVTAPTESEISLEIAREFWNSINIADKIIFIFSVNTTDSDLLKDVKIYSDYSINFNAALVLKPNIDF